MSNPRRILTKEGPVNELDVRADGGLQRALANNNYGKWCTHREHCQRPMCTYLHPATPSAHGDGPAAHRDVHTGPRRVQQHHDNVVIHRPTQRRDPASRRQGAQVSQDVLNVLDDFKNSGDAPWTPDVARAIVTCLEGGVSERIFLRALEKTLKEKQQCDGGSIREDEVVAINHLVVLWVKKLPDAVIACGGTDASTAVLLTTIVSLAAHRHAELDRHFVEAAKKLLASIAPDSRGDNVAQLEGAIQRHEEKRLQRLGAGDGGQRHLAARGPTAYMDDGIALDDASVLCDERDFSDGRSREMIQKSLQSIVVDAPIPIDAGHLHIKQLFRVYREDFVACVRAAVRIIRQTVLVLPREERRVREDGSLPPRVYHSIREMDEHGDVRLYTSLRCIGITAHVREGLVFRFALNMRQFGNRVVDWGKRLMQGNLILLSTTWFQPNTTMFVGVVQRCDERRDPPGRGASPAKAAEFAGEFLVAFETPAADVLRALTSGSSFCALESTSYFLPYHRVLTVIKGMRAPFPLASALLSGNTEQLPPYLQNCRHINVGTSVKLIAAPTPPPRSYFDPRRYLAGQQPPAGDGFAVIDVLNAEAWKRCAPWTAEGEQSASRDQQAHCVDDTQREALKHIFSHNIAVIQGTPGTGKTFIGAKFTQILLRNFDALGCGPILCVCFTNHAIDAFLKDILKVERSEHITRIGGQSKDPDIDVLALHKKMRGCRGGKVCTDQVERFRVLSKSLVTISALQELTPSDFTELAAAITRDLQAPNAKQFVKLLERAQAERQSNRDALFNQIGTIECGLKNTVNKINQILSQHNNIRIGDVDALKAHQANYRAAEAMVRDEEHALAKMIDDDVVKELRAPSPQQTILAIKKEIEGCRAQLKDAVAQEQALKKANKNGKGKQETTRIETAQRSMSAADASVPDADLAVLEESIKDLEVVHRRLVNASKRVLAASKRLSSMACFSVDACNELRCLLELKQTLEKKCTERRKDVAEQDALLSRCALELWRAKGRAAVCPRNQATGPPASQLLPTHARNLDAPFQGTEDLNRAYQRQVAQLERDVQQDDSDDETGSDCGEVALAGSRQYTHEALVQKDRELAQLFGGPIAVTGNVNAIPANARERMYQILMWMWQMAVHVQLRALMDAIAEDKARRDRLETQEKVKFLRTQRVVGATTAGCAANLSVMQMLQPKVVIVEEAAEVLEPHVLACLTTNVQHLVLVGDHKQLQPKVQEHVLGKHKHLGTSLMERLVRIGAPYVTLATQRRMHPDISDFTKAYYLSPTHPQDVAVIIRDHPATDTHKVPVGIRDGARVFFVQHDGQGDKAEAEMPGLKSKYNTYEANLCLTIADWMLKSNGGATVTVLLPYSGQVVTALRLAKEFSIPYQSKVHPDGIKIISIDDYQGEESDFIVLSLTRTKELGFLNVENRACVALSRARRGMYIVGCTPCLAETTNALWKTCLRIVVARKAIGDAFPAVCQVHQDMDLAFTSWRQAPSCKRLCAMPLPGCNHRCQGVCHHGDDRHAPCMEACDRTGIACRPQRKCEHACTKKCHEACGDCKVLVDVVCASCGHIVRVPCHASATVVCKRMLTKPGPCNPLHDITAECFKWQNGDAAVMCKHMCQEPMRCGHVCRRACHRDDPGHTKGMLLCTAKKVIKHPRCKQHDVTVLCNQDVLTYPACEAMCGGLAPCGHPCEMRCGECQASGGDGKQHVCRTRSQSRQLPCGHTHNVRCGDEAFVCPAPCLFVLDCSHRCSGTCGTCQGSPHWYNHRPCRGHCTKVNACGHKCNKGCSAGCQCCTAECDYSCGHGTGCSGMSANNKHTCGTCSYRNCQEPCDWTCEHKRCTKLCTQPCDREPCDAPCSKRRSQCEHQDEPCLGVCGEACPSFCRRCFRSSIERNVPYPPREKLFCLNVYLMEDEVDDYLLGDLDLSTDPSIQSNPTALRLVELPCCGTIMLAGELDQLIDAKCSSDAVAAPRCLRCSHTLYSNFYRRKSIALKGCHRDLEVIRQRELAQFSQSQAAHGDLMDDAKMLVLSMFGTDNEKRMRWQADLDMYSSFDRPVKPRCPVKLPKSANENQRNQQKSRIAKYEADLKAWERSEQCYSDLQTTLEQQIPAQTQGHLVLPATAAVRILISLAATEEDDRNPNALNAFRSQLQCVEVLVKFAEGLRKYPQVAALDVTRFFTSIPKTLQTAKLSANDASKLLDTANLQWMQHRLLVVAVIAAQLQSVTATVGAPPHVQQRVAVRTDDIEVLLQRARDAVGQQQFFLRGTGRPVFHPNPCLSTGCSAFQRFANGVAAATGCDASAPWGVANAPTRIVFHGTSREAISEIACRGFDVQRRRGQAHGPGEYFGATADVSSGYVKGDERMLVCAVLNSAARSASQHILVVNNPTDRLDTAYVLPLGVVLYGQRVFTAPGDTPYRCSYPHQRPTEAVDHLLLVLREAIARGAVPAIGLKALDQRIAALEQQVGVERPSRMLLQSITTALGVTAGHWYKCPNGHLYVIGDCGGAMTTAKCSECGAAVGGNQHRLLSTNASAAGAVVAGATAPWPT